MTRGLLAILGATMALLAAVPAPAQVRLPGVTGLGRVIAPLDARARGLGGAAVSLHGGNLSAVNPASVVRLNTAGVWFTFMPEDRTVKGEGLNGDVQTADFPLGRAALPLSRRWTASIAFGSFLDQNWSVQFVDTLRLSTGDVAFEETRMSDGAVTQFRFELARVMSEKFSLGIAAQLYSGEIRRTVDRAFVAASRFGPSRLSAAIQYSGWGAALGMEYQPIPEMILGAVVSWGPGLDASNDSTGEEIDFDLPITFDFGGSWQLTHGLLFALGLGWSGWSALDDQLPDGGASDAWRVSSGLELAALSGISNSLLLRIGGHLERQPFELRGGAPVERALSLGLGLQLRGGRARIDTAFEIGSRGSVETNGVKETFTRTTFSLAVFSP